MEAEREDEKKLDAIKAEQGNDNTEHAIKMLQYWLEKKPNGSWNDLIRVLRLSHIGLNTTAGEIEDMLLPESM